MNAFVLFERHLRVAFSLQQIRRVYREAEDRYFPLGKRIRAQKEMKVPYVVVVGDKESASDKLTVELRNGEKLEDLQAEEFIVRVSKEARERSL